MTAGAVAALLAGRARLAALVLGLAIATKLYPLLLLPLFAIVALRRAGRRAAAAVVGIAAATVAIVVLPFLALAPGEAWFSIRAQLTRGLQVESLPGSVVLALGRVADELGLGALGTGVAEGGTGDVRSADVTGTLGSVVGSLAGLARGRGGRRDVGRRVAERRGAGAARPGLRGGRRRPGRPRPGPVAAVRALARARSSRSWPGAAGVSRAAFSRPPSS